MTNNEQKNNLYANHETHLSKNSEVEELTYILSHDLRASLRHAKMFSQFLSEECQKNEHTQYDHHIEMVQKAILKLEEQLNALLLYSRIGRTDLKIEKINFEGIVNEVLNTLNTQCKIIKSNTALDIFADEQEFKKLIYHLLDNALKFKENQANHTIEIRAEELTNEFAFHVQDNGIGIDSRYHEKIFNFFQRLQPNKYPGLGMGLPICKKIAALHYGRLIVVSEAGKGSSFSLIIPKLKNLTPGGRIC